MSSHEKVAKVVQMLRDAQMHSCAHVFEDEPVMATVCILHPSSGVLCVPCQQEHVDRHDGSCVECDGPLDDEAPDWFAFDVPVDVPAMSLTRPNTVVVAIWRGRVHLVAGVMCAECVDGVVPAA